MGAASNREAAGWRGEAVTVPVLLSVWIPALPQRVLSGNAGSRSRRDPWAVANARGLLKGEVMAALLSLGPVPCAHFERARVTVTLRLTNKKPKAMDCGQCVELMAAGDYPRWSIPANGASPVPCCHYRPKDVGNIGGDVLKPILDAFTWLEVWPDDDFTHVPEVTLKIERVAEIADEGIAVTVEQLEPHRGGRHTA